jgi:hypothetical protein
MGAVPGCFCCPNPYQPVDQGNVGLVTRFGRFTRAVDPGLVKVNPLAEKLIQVDVKIQIVGMFKLHTLPPFPSFISALLHPPLVTLPDSIWFFLRSFRAKKVGERKKGRKKS